VARQARRSSTGAWCRLRSRGEIVREIADELRAPRTIWVRWSPWRWARSWRKDCGEVQEMIDIADFAVGLSRQLYGLTMHSERPGASHVRAVASAGNRGRDQRVQFPGSGVGVERHDRGGVRRLRAVAALVGHAAHGDRGAENCNRVLDRHGLKGIFNLVIGKSDPIAEA
jgi:hypothetical protein